MKLLMKMLVLCTVIAVVTCSLAIAAAPNGRYLVVFKSAVLPQDAAQKIISYGGKVIKSFEQIGVVTAIGNAAFANKMAKDKLVLSVGPEHMFEAPEPETAELADAAVPDAGPNAADFFYFYYQWDIRRVGAPAVWERGMPTGARVAVLDVGVMNDHPDLAGQVDRSVATSYCPSENGYPKYTKYIDLDTYPNWTPSIGCSNLPAESPVYQAHGTHVAGTIAANFGGGGVVGVAPDAKIGAYKVFDAYRYNGTLRLGAFDSAIFQGIIDATLTGYRVISMSLGSYGVRNDKDYNASWHAWDRVAKWANRSGALIVASAGNSPISLNGVLYHIPSDLSTVMSTSATATSQLMDCGDGTSCAAPGSDYLASYSSYGAAVDISAPGGDCYKDDCATGAYEHPEYWILNAGIGEDSRYPSFGKATYYFMQGTSMATPHVSAVAAWVFAMHPDWTPGDVRSWLKTTAEPIGPRQFFGAGIVNADAAAQ